MRQHPAIKCGITAAGHEKGCAAVGFERHIIMKQFSKEEIGQLIDTAMAQLAYSYVPYSHFHVGAALLAKNGTVYTGCNIENAAYSPSNCAEHTAFFRAISEGCREFEAIAIVGNKEGEKGDFCPPCGVCRQVMAEFCNPDQFRIILGRSGEEYYSCYLKDLLPFGFGSELL